MWLDAIPWSKLRHFDYDFWIPAAAYDAGARSSNNRRTAMHLTRRCYLGATRTSQWKQRDTRRSESNATIGTAQRQPGPFN